MHGNFTVRAGQHTLGKGDNLTVQSTEKLEPSVAQYLEAGDTVTLAAHCGPDGILIKKVGGWGEFTLTERTLRNAIGPCFVPE